MGSVMCGSGKLNEQSACVCEVFDMHDDIYEIILRLCRICERFASDAGFFLSGIRIIALDGFN